MDGKGLIKLESEQQWKELLQAVRSAGGGGGEGKAKAKEPTKRKVYTLLSFERGVAVPAISVLAVKTSACRDSQPERIRAIMLSDPGPDLERISIAAPCWWRFCGVSQAKNFEGVLILAYGCQTCLPSESLLPVPAFEIAAGQR